jgi:hypothetical protein
MVSVVSIHHGQEGMGENKSSHHGDQEAEKKRRHRKRPDVALKIHPPSNLFPSTRPYLLAFNTS